MVFLERNRSNFLVEDALSPLNGLKFCALLCVGALTQKNHRHKSTSHQLLVSLAENVGAQAFAWELRLCFEVALKIDLPER